MVVNNISRSASMYYLKTIYTLLLSIAAIVLNVPYPFIPLQITVMNMFVEGMPSTLTTFEPNYVKPKESVLRFVARYALPQALTIGIGFILIVLFMGDGQRALTDFYILAAFQSMWLIVRLFKPMHWYRAVVLVVASIGFIATVSVFRTYLEIAELSLADVEPLAIILVLSLLISGAIAWLIRKCQGPIEESNEIR